MSLKVPFKINMLLLVLHTPSALVQQVVEWIEAERSN
jgi:hypothetical protein